MNKAFVDQLIKNMLKAKVLVRSTPWTMEAVGSKEFHVRYAGLRVNEEWQSVFSSTDNLLIKFSINRTEGHAELFLANRPPFIKIANLLFSTDDKWEIMLGEIKQKLKKDKQDFLKHQDKIDNLFVKLRPHLK